MYKRQLTLEIFLEWDVWRTDWCIQLIIKARVRHLAASALYHRGNSPHCGVYNLCTSFWAQLWLTASFVTMTDRDPGPSTDYGMYANIMCVYIRINGLQLSESSPLLRSPEEEGNFEEQPSFSDRVNAVAQEPLTPLTKILLILVLTLLLASSVSTVNYNLCMFLTWHHQPPGLHWSLRWCPT